MGVLVEDKRFDMFTRNRNTSQSSRSLIQVAAMEDANVEMELTIFWSDVDGNGHVNNVALFRMFQDTRSQIMQPLREIGAAAQTATLVVVHVELDFKSSAVLGDVLVCSAKLVEIQNKTFRIAFEARTRGKNVLVASGYCVCAMQGQGRAIPLAEVKGLLEGLEIARSKRIRHHIASKL